MNKTFLIRGDTHRNFDWLSEHRMECFIPEETAIIILGDVGINVGWKSDKNLKRRLNETGYTFYCLRGNHEMRPSDVMGMKRIWDPGVQGIVWQEDEYPNIKYFQDVGIYYIKTDKREYRTLCLGGAYSVDKYYRLANNLPWWPNEQLTELEMKEAENLITQTSQYFDFVFAHTCPMSMRPTDRFLPIVDQSTVDNTMEEWLEQFQNKIHFNAMCCGHYHVDRIVSRHKYLYFNCIDLLDDVYNWSNKLGEINNIDRV